MQGETSRSRPRKLRLIAGLFLGVLAAFTLAGNTLQALTLPKVHLAAASSGKLILEFRGSATVRPEAEKEIANPAGWKVAKVFVNKGDHVRKGETLIEYDDREAKEQLLSEQSALKKMELSIEDLQLDYIKAAQEGDESAKQQAASKIEIAKLDLSNQQRHIQLLQDKLEEGRRIAAPFDGVVTEVNAAQGSPSSGAPDIRMFDPAQGYRFEMRVPEPIVDRLRVGEQLDVRIPDDESHPAVPGTIADIRESAATGDVAGEPAGTERTSTLVVSLQGNQFQGGERVRLDIRLAGSAEMPLIPSDAVHKDNEGVFVYIVEEKQGPLGNAYYAVRVPITISEANDSTTAVDSGLFEQQQVIVASSEPIMDGMRVRIY